MTTEEVLQKLGTDREKGVSHGEAKAWLKEAGKNVLQGEEGISPLELIIKQIKNPLIYLLLAAAIGSLLAGKYIDAGVIFVIILINTIIGFTQEWRAEKALEELQKKATPTAKVIRSGEKRQINAEEVVPGDLVVIDPGDRVPADIRIIQEDELEIDESALSGESEPVNKNSEKVDEDTLMADMADMAWMSTAVTSGNGVGIVVETGMNTEIGKIAGEVQKTRREETPLQKKIKTMGRYIGIAGVSLAAIVFLLGLFRGYEFKEMILFAIAVAVASIPEGLPAVISVTLALGVQRMADRNAIVQRLPSVETLGSTTFVCSDKTGTITENKMTVVRIYTEDGDYEITGLGYEPEGKIKLIGSGDEVPLDNLPDELDVMLRIGILANNAGLIKEEDQWQIDGDPTEGALIVAAAKAGLDPDKLNEEYPRKDEIPFSSDNKYMAVLCNQKAYVKGAPEKIIDICSKIMKKGRISVLDDSQKDELRNVYKELAGDALRMVAGGFKDVDDSSLTEEEVESGLIFTGFWGMIDPPRKEAVESIKKARQAGIKTVMLTGDHAITATEIAKKVGIGSGKTAVTGRDVEESSKENVAEYARDVGVFARVTPSHKLKIMDSLKDRGEIVAMTGDGVNDAPSLKGADIGVAMGRSGTDVAREAADMVLTDDNFTTIINAVEEGRVIYSNLKRVIFFLLGTNIAEVMLPMLALIFGMKLPITALMILWVNLVTEVACTIPLGIEPRHQDVLKNPPREPAAPIIDSFILRRLAILSPVIALGTLAVFYHQSQTVGVQHARTVSFTTLAAFQWFQAFNARSSKKSVFSIGIFSNRWLLVGIGSAVVLQLGAIYTGLGQMIFDTVNLGWSDWALVIGASCSILIVDEIMKKFRLYGESTID